MFIVTKNMHKITTNEKNFLRSSYFINKINPVKKIIFFIKPSNPRFESSKFSERYTFKPNIVRKQKIYN